MRVFETTRIGPVELPNRLALAPAKVAFAHLNHVDRAEIPALLAVEGAVG
jgi:2,4-dienoyl-CoA reductase-like NADH-dependent reductase (Old Yellow Enzyme family)